MSEEKQPDGGDGSGGSKPPAPPQKTTEQRLAEIEESGKKQAAQLQSTQEELKRVNNLNAVLMSRLQAGGAGAPPPADGGGMDVNRTVPIKLKRDFSQLDPTAEPQRFATELVLEVAEQTREAIASAQHAQATSDQLRRAFYEKNKDLTGWEIEVGHWANVVQAQNPGLPFDQAADLIAQKTRDYLKSRGLTSPAPDPNNPGGQPPSVLPPSSGGDGKVPIKPPTDGKNEPFDPDKVYQEDMKDYSGMRNKERDRMGDRAGKA